MAILNPFAAFFDAFDAHTLASAIDEFGIRYGRVTQMALARTERITTEDFDVERRHDQLVLLKTQPKDGSGNHQQQRTRDYRSFKTRHIPLEDVVHPKEVANRRRFGSEATLEDMNAIMAEHLDDAAASFDLTDEHLLIGMLKGVVLDADGSVLWDWFDEFGISPVPTQNFVFSAATTDVIADPLMKAKRQIQKGLLGDVITGYGILASEGWFEALMSHDDIKERLKYTQPGATDLRNDVRDGIRIGNVFIEEYHAAAVDQTGTARKFIADNEAHMFPLGTRNTFRIIRSPMESSDFVNTPGRDRYTKIERRKYDKGWDVHHETNVATLCQKPKALVKLTLS